MTKVRTLPADSANLFSHNANMARRGIPKDGVSWFLRDWMEARGFSGRGAQARMMDATGWSKATMSQLYNGEQDYSPRLLNDAARALGVEPYQLLMRPDQIAPGLPSASDLERHIQNALDTLSQESRAKISNALLARFLSVQLHIALAPPGDHQSTAFVVDPGLDGETEEGAQPHPPKN